MPAQIGFTSPGTLAAALALAGLIIAIAWRRRIALPPLSLTLIAAGLLLWACAAGGLLWHHPTQREVTVLVDLSASTRTAQYRDVESLQRRINQLLGSTPYRTIYFAETHRTTAENTPHLPDLPGDHTLFPPTDAPAILLFSDGQFDLPTTAPPVYVAIDPLLQDPADAAVAGLELRGPTLAATVRNSSPDPRPVTLTPGNTTETAAPGTVILTKPLPDNTPEASATLSNTDPWPENDRLTLRIPPPALSQRWWVGPDAPPNYRPINPAALPVEPTDYLAPAIIVLNNTPATALSDLQQQRLQQYVRDLGGSLLLLGGDHAFAAGVYPGTALETLSPLSSSPPSPTVHWILLADSSGSMASSEAGVSRWEQVRQAMLRLLPHLPPEDPATLGDFAERVRWWSVGKSARETAQLPLADIAPQGPTNLEPALLEVISRFDTGMPKELLLLTDADAQITQPDALRDGLLAKKIRLNLLALRDDGRALRPLEQLVQTTGGQSLRELNPAKWTQAMRRLYEQASADHLIQQPATLRYTPDLPSLPPRSLPTWNRTWLKPSATLLAETQTPDGAAPLAAQWGVGAGQVLAAAFPANPTEIATFANRIAQPPRDPRFRVTWDPGANLRVTIDATDANRYLNEQPLELELTSIPPTTTPSQRMRIPQTAPGRYELALPAPRRPALATLRLGNQVLDRLPLAGRYPPEFDQIGNNPQTLQTLATRTAGAIIPPTQTNPIDFHWPPRSIPLRPWLATIGALLIAAGLLRWRFA